MSHGDYTGNRKAQLAEQFRKEQQEAAKRTSMVAQLQQEISQEVVDIIPDGFDNFEDYQLHMALQRDGYESAKRRHWGLPEEDDSAEGDVLELGDVQDALGDPNFAPQEFRAADTAEGVSFGAGGDNVFDLDAGHVYRAPKWVVDHLKEKYLVAAY